VTAGYDPATRALDLTFTILVVTRILHGSVVARCVQDLYGVSASVVAGLVARSDPLLARASGNPDAFADDFDSTRHPLSAGIGVMMDLWAVVFVATVASAEHDSDVEAL
jgi:hypothetical protein